MLDPATRTAQIEVEIAEPAVPPEAGHVRQGRASPSDKQRRTRWSSRPTRSSTSAADAACSCPRGRTGRGGEVQAGRRRHDRTRRSSRSRRGLDEGDRVVTTGAAALREGDRIVLPARRRAGRPRRQARRRERRPRTRPRRAAGAARARGRQGGAARAAARRPAGGRRRRAGGGRAAVRDAVDGRTRQVERFDSQELGMSIPRFAIQRPVMMTMISAIVILLGGISLTRLPVDLLPDISQPTINVRVNYTGVGPLEMEELVTRPLEQQLSAVSGLEQMNSTSQRRQQPTSSMNFTWGTTSTRRWTTSARASTACAAACPRTPIRRSSRSSTRTRSRSWAWRSRASTARSTASQLRELAENDAVAAPRARARRRGGHRQRRPAPADSRRAVAARRSPRSTSRSIASSTSCGPRTRTSRSARSTRATARSCCAARGSSRTSTRSGTSSS